MLMPLLNSELDSILYNVLETGKTLFFLESFELYHCSWNPTTGILLKITDYSKLRNEKKAKGKKPLRNQSFWIVLNFDFALHYRWEALDNTTTVAAVFTRGVQSAYKNSLLGSGAKTRLVFISALIIAIVLSGTVRARKGDPKVGRTLPFTGILGELMELK